MSIRIAPKDLDDKIFRIKKIQYNTYEINHPQVKGTLRLMNLPTNIMQVPEEKIPQQQRTSSDPTFMVGGQTIVSFTNKGDKKEPTSNPKKEDMRKAKKIELAGYMEEQPFEPWNEFVIQGDPPIILKRRTILSKVEWYVDYTNQLGDPYLWASHNTTDSVSSSETGDAGLT
ncbi:MAG: hypothetical protein J4F36_13345 [Nitrosopumilaceae archaeon]|nr:hypothetical protein [Nitrosopumilaceae archaeon]